MEIDHNNDKNFYKTTKISYQFIEIEHKFFPTAPKKKKKFPLTEISQNPIYSQPNITTEMFL